MGSSLESLKQKFRDFFDPTLTPAGAPIQTLVQDVSSFLSGRDLNRFVSETFEMVDEEEQLREFFLPDPIAPNAQSFLVGLLRYGSENVEDTTTKFIIEDRERCYHFLRASVEFVHIAGDDPTLVRWLWNRAKTGEADYSLVSALLRNKLIPPNEIQEALRTFISKAPPGRPSEDEREELKKHGFYDELKNAAATSDIMSDFGKANRCRTLLVDLLDRVEIDHALAKAIYKNFDVDNHPWKLCDALRDFFAARPDKREEYRRAISGDNELGIPKHLDILATE